ncbi:MAG: hypothetical protein IJ753_00900 [Bacteroidales bacterium]|nr:hypothetical protein [Bacteroidales bacterium]MBR1782062.1 hypothetical protein [Bacteroidales bacterium]
MKKKLLKYLLAVVAVWALFSCSKVVNNWVYVKADVSGFPSEADSLMGVAMAGNLEKAAYGALGETPYELVYDRASSLESMKKAADAFYDEVKDTVTFEYTLTLNKILSTVSSDGSKMKEPLNTYIFN